MLTRPVALGALALLAACGGSSAARPEVHYRVEYGTADLAGRAQVTFDDPSGRKSSITVDLPWESGSVGADHGATVSLHAQATVNEDQHLVCEITGNDKASNNNAFVSAPGGQCEVSYTIAR